jgi:uncharacterized protein DUF2848
VHQLTFAIDGVACTGSIDTLVVAGWTGRDVLAVEQHIAELAAVGVQRPASVPCFYRLGTNLLTQAAAIDVIGSSSSGEVEFVLVSLPGGLHVGVGSDHTDRTVETYSVTVSKQMCPKPLGRELWAFSDVADHWDDLVLRSWVTRHGVRELYQEGAVDRILPAADLVERYLGRRGALPVGTAMYCGTLTALGTICGGERFEIELHDPKRNRKLRHTYLARCLESTESKGARRTDGHSQGAQGVLHG